VDLLDVLRADPCRHRGGLAALQQGDDRGKGHRAGTEQGRAAEELLPVQVHGTLYHAPAGIDEPEGSIAGHIEDAAQRLAVDLAWPMDCAAFEFSDVVRVELNPLVVVLPDMLVDEFGEFLAAESLTGIPRRGGALPRRPQQLVR
jgi:hypothetical protein